MWKWVAPEAQPILSHQEACFSPQPPLLPLQRGIGKDKPLERAHGIFLSIPSANHPRGLAGVRHVGRAAGLWA